MKRLGVALALLVAGCEYPSGGYGYPAGGGYPAPIYYPPPPPVQPASVPDYRAITGTRTPVTCQQFGTLIQCY